MMVALSGIENRVRDWGGAPPWRLNRYCMDNAGEVTYFLWEGLNLLEERNADGSLKVRYTHGYTPIEGIGSIVEAERHTATATYFQYLHMDHRGTVYKVTDAAENTQIEYTQDAFGRELASPGGGDPNVPNDSIYQTNWRTMKIGGREYELSPSRIRDPLDGQFLQRDFLPNILKILSYAAANVLGIFYKTDLQGVILATNDKEGRKLGWYEYLVTDVTSCSDPTGLTIVANSKEEKHLWDRLAWYACLKIRWAKRGRNWVTTGLNRLKLPGKPGTEPVRGPGPAKDDVCTKCSETLRDRIEQIQNQRRNITIAPVGTIRHIRTRLGEIHIAKYKDVAGNKSSLGKGEQRDSFVEQFAHEALREQEAADRGIPSDEEAPVHIQDPKGAMYEWFALEQGLVMSQLTGKPNIVLRKARQAFADMYNEAKKRLTIRGTYPPDGKNLKIVDKYLDKISAEISRIIDEKRRKAGLPVPGKPLPGKP